MHHVPPSVLALPIVACAALLWIYDLIVKPGAAPAK